MLRTLPEDRKKKKKPAKKKTAAKKKAPKKKTVPKKIALNKQEKSLNSKMYPVSDKAAKDIVKYRDGSTSTYGEFLQHFEERTNYIMSLNDIKPETVERIIYINSTTAGLNFVDGKKRFLSIGYGAEEGE